MFKNLGLHIIEFPSGRHGYVGSIPTDLCKAVPATHAAIMGCRSWRGEDGRSMEWKAPTFSTEQEAIDFAKSRGHSPMVRNVAQ